MLVADGFTKEAWNAARSDGLLVATPRHLFGEAVAAGLRELVQTLSNAAAAAAKNPEVIWTLFSKLGEVEGAAANLRGPLFEMIVAHGVRAVDGASIEIGKQVAAPSGQLAEVDVLATKPDHWRFIECRGHAPGHRVSLDQVKTWCEEKVPRIREWALNRIERTQTRMSFEYWTTGTFEGEAEEYLDRRRSRTNKYDLARMDGPAVLEYARRVGSRHIVDTLNEHYFRHPLAHAVGREEAHGPGDTASGAPSSNSRDLDSRPR